MSEMWRRRLGRGMGKGSELEPGGLDVVEPVVGGGGGEEGQQQSATLHD
jgi:hypothetical protein